MATRAAKVLSRDLDLYAQFWDIVHDRTEGSILDIKPQALTLMNQNRKGNIARRKENQEALRQRLELVEIFAEVRGALGQTFRGETFYGPSIHDES